MAGHRCYVSLDPLFLTASRNGEKNKGNHFQHWMNPIKCLANNCVNLKFEQPKIANQKRRPIKEKRQIKDKHLNCRESRIPIKFVDGSLDGVSWRKARNLETFHGQPARKLLGAYQKNSNSSRVQSTTTMMPGSPNHWMCINV